SLRRHGLAGRVKLALGNPSWWREREPRRPRSAGCDDNGLALGGELDCDSASAGKQAGIERLHRMGIDTAILGPAFEEPWNGLRDARIEARRRDPKPHGLA